MAFSFPQWLSAFFNGFPFFLNGFPLSDKSEKIYLWWQVYKRSLFELRISRHLLLELCNSHYNVYISPTGTATAMATATPTARVVRSLCRPHEPCKYSIKDGVIIPQGFLEDTAPHSFAVFGGEITEVLALSLLWAVFEGAVTVNRTKCSIVPIMLGDKIKRKWPCAGGSVVNPIERILVSVQQFWDQLMITSLFKRISATKAESEGGAVSAEEAGLTGQKPQGGVRGVGAQMPCFPNFL
jgi:hypothetical protein